MREPSIVSRTNLFVAFPFPESMFALARSRVCFRRFQSLLARARARSRGNLGIVSSFREESRCGEFNLDSY